MLHYWFRGLVLSVCNKKWLWCWVALETNWISSVWLSCLKIYTMFCLKVFFNRFTECIIGWKWWLVTAHFLLASSLTASSSFCATVFHSLLVILKSGAILHTDCVVKPLQPTSTGNSQVFHPFSLHWWTRSWRISSPKPLHTYLPMGHLAWSGWSYSTPQDKVWTTVERWVSSPNLPHLPWLSFLQEAFPLLSCSRWLCPSSSTCWTFAWIMSLLCLPSALLHCLKCIDPSHFSPCAWVTDDISQFQGCLCLCYWGVSSPLPSGACGDTCTTDPFITAQFWLLTRSLTYKFDLCFHESV